MTEPSDGAALLRRALLTLATEPNSTSTICNALADLAAETGDHRLGHAARVAGGSAGGRPLIDDAEAVERVVAIMRRGVRAWPAAKTIAAEIVGAADETSVAKRLLRKVKETFHETDFVNAAD